MPAVPARGRLARLRTAPNVKGPREGRRAEAFALV